MAEIRVYIEKMVELENFMMRMKIPFRNSNQQFS